MRAVTASERFALAPPELIELDQWVAWRSEVRDGRATKVPYAVGGGLASTTDPSTWASFEAAAEVLERGEFDGIGFVLVASDPFVAIDIDDCLMPDGRLHPAVAELLVEFDSYAEWSPGDGLHVFMLGTLDGFDRHKTTDTPWGGEFAAYSETRYFTVTGLHVAGNPFSIEPRQAEITRVMKRMFPKAAESSPRATDQDAVGGFEGSDEELLDAARTARNGEKFVRLFDDGDTTGFDSPSERDLALVQMIVFWTGPDVARVDRLFRKSACYRPTKWDRESYGRRTLAKALSRAREFYTPPRARPTRSANDYLRTDLGNAELLADRNADRLRHVRERRLWLTWSSGRWRPDVTGEAERAAKEVARERLRAAAEIDDPDKRKTAVMWALESQSNSRIRAMISLAATEPAVVLRAEELDSDPLLLSCANGVVDLRTGELRKPDPDDLISMGNEIAFDPTATCPRWRRFLAEIFAGDRELIRYIHRLVGYSMTGDAREQIVAVLHGGGCNGKDTLLKPIQKILGDHAVTAGMDTFVRSRDRGVRNDLARLHRARLVVASESAEGRRLDEPTIKAISVGTESQRGSSTQSTSSSSRGSQPG